MLCPSLPASWQVAAKPAPATPPATWPALLVTPPATWPALPVTPPATCPVPNPINFLEVPPAPLSLRRLRRRRMAVLRRPFRRETRGPIRRRQLVT
jgi:hypothetical protein